MCGASEHDSKARRHRQYSESSYGFLRDVVLLFIYDRYFPARVDN
jgi:hypothetical protein